MQEQKASKATSLLARFGIWNVIWLGICGAMVLVAAFAWLWPYRTLSTASWREANSTLPWTAPGIVVQDFSGMWKSSAGNERMMLRATYYPAANIELGSTQGDGLLYIRFTNGNGHQLGDTISLPYKNGAFQPRHEVNIRAEGSKAHVYVEAGFESKQDFELHTLDESAPLWRAHLYFRPDGDTSLHALGSVTIPAFAQ